MEKYSIFSLIKNAFSNHEKWDLAWKDPNPKKEYLLLGGEKIDDLRYGENNIILFLWSWVFPGHFPVHVV